MKEDAALGDQDLLSDMLPPAESQPNGSKQQLESEIHTRQHEPFPARSGHRKFSKPAEAAFGSAQPIQEASFKEEAGSSAASAATEDDLSDDAMLARLIEVQQGGAGPSEPQEDDEGSGEWEHVADEDASQPITDVAEDFQDLHMESQPAAQPPAEPLQDALHDADPDDEVAGQIACFADCLLLTSSIVHAICLGGVS